MSRRLGEHYDRYSKPNFQQSNFDSFDVNRYDKVYTQENNAQLSTKQEPNIEYENKELYLSVSSRDRNTSDYPNVNSYLVDLPYEIKNIYSIELLQAIIPDVDALANQPYLLLKIDELEDVMISNDRNISDAFAILQLSPPSYGFIQLDKRIHENTVKYYQTPKAVLSRMTINITNYEGTLIDFGADLLPNGKPNPILQNTFIFKVITQERNRNLIQHRNIF